MFRIKKILFLNPPDPSLLGGEQRPDYSYFEPPLGLLYVYDFVKKRGDIDVAFFDLNIEMKFLSKMSLKDILETKIKEFQPDLIAVATLYYTQIQAYHEVAKLIKEINTDITVVFGGHYPHHLTEKCMADTNVDYAVLSEGELGMSDLIDVLNGKKNMGDIQGVAFRKDGNLNKIPRSVFWKGYSDSGRLPWEDTPFQYYFKEGRNLLYRLKPKAGWKIAAITASRGCPNACTFCTSPSFWNRRWRKRKVTHIIDEITYLKDTHGVNTIVFNDENISIDKKWFIELLDGLSKLHINWISSGGFAVRSINDDEVIKKMYESGVCFFNLGIESGSDETLQKIKKPLKSAETLELIRLIRKYGDAFICAFVVVGFPFENMATVKQTLEYDESLDVDWHNYHCFRPLPGSELFKDCINDGLISNFDPFYAELYFAPELKHIDYTSAELDRLIYLANLNNNFIRNRNLMLGTEESLAQAERDFLYVLEMVPDHVFACLGLAEIMRMRNQPEARIYYIGMAKKHAEASKFNWGDYLSELNVDIDKLYQDVSSEFGLADSGSGVISIKQ